MSATVQQMTYELLTSYRKDNDTLRQSIAPFNDLIRYQRQHIAQLEQANQYQAEKITSLEAVLKQMNEPAPAPTQPEPKVPDVEDITNHQLDELAQSLPENGRIAGQPMGPTTESQTPPETMNQEEYQNALDAASTQSGDT